MFVCWRACLFVWNARAQRADGRGHTDEGVEQVDEIKWESAKRDRAKRDRAKRDRAKWDRAGGAPKRESKRSMNSCGSPAAHER